MLVAVITRLASSTPERAHGDDITTWRQYLEIALRGQGARWISLRQPPTWCVFAPMMRGSRLQTLEKKAGGALLAWRTGGRVRAVALSHQISVAGAGSTLAGRSGSGFPGLSPDFGPPSIASSHVPDEHGELCSATASAGPILPLSCGRRCDGQVLAETRQR